ncbi:MAG TPA: hydrolase/acyltransferase [Bacilli bacterium]
MPDMRYCILNDQGRTLFVEIPASHAYQLTALHQRLHKEIGKLTAAAVPSLPIVLAECEHVEIVDPELSILKSIDYINQMEKTWAAIDERHYPLISLLTEIRALQAQLEQWYEDEMSG